MLSENKSFSDENERFDSEERRVRCEREVSSQGLNRDFAEVSTNYMFAQRSPNHFLVKMSGSTHLKSGLKKERITTRVILSFFGAGSRGRTDTVLLPSDFESDASANSTIPAWRF